MNPSFHLKSRRVVFPDGVRPATIEISDGLIGSILAYDAVPDAQDLGDLALLPGCVDPHVHFNEPGRTEWEGWLSGTKAALAGGVTSVVEMPLNSIPSTVDLASLELKRESMVGKLFCDVGLWAGAVPGNRTEFRELLDNGVLGFKCFLSDPGTAEFRNLDESGLKEAMEEIASLDSVLLIHAEWPDRLLDPDARHSPNGYTSWLATRPVEAELEAVRRVVALAKETGCRCHIVHVSSAEVLAALEGSTVTCETCAHYLVFSAEEVADGATNFKCAPPIRERAHQEGLWQALKEGRIQMITSDHSPCPPEMKNDNFLESWGGIAGVQMLLPAVWTGASSRGFLLSDVARWLSSAPAQLAGLSHRVGRIETGLEANLVVFSPEEEWECTELYHRHGGSPYQGRHWKGCVKACFLRGERVWDVDSKVCCSSGRALTRQVVGGTDERTDRSN